MLIENNGGFVLVKASTVENDEVAGYVHDTGREREIDGELWMELSPDEWAAMPRGEPSRPRSIRGGGAGSGQRTLRFGKYKGRVLATVPTSYLKYLLEWPKLHLKTRHAILAHLASRPDSPVR
jgi:hypothetical protein